MKPTRKLRPGWPRLRAGTEASRGPKAPKPAPHFLIRWLGRARAQGLLREAEFRHFHD